jgi:hypothetical protein
MPYISLFWGQGSSLLATEEPFGGCELLLTDEVFFPPTAFGKSPFASAVAAGLTFSRVARKPVSQSAFKGDAGHNRSDRRSRLRFPLWRFLEW